MPDTAVVTVDSNSGEVLPPALAILQAPTETLREAQTAAVALQDVIKRKPKPVILNGEQYLEFEDWQTLGRFYGVTAKVEAVEPVQLGEVSGFHATAVALLADGRVISRAESYCTQDEANWKAKPLFQLASMAQTRACAKSLRNVLAWVVVLAGYKATPAEELEPELKTATPKRPPSSAAKEAGLITPDQQKRFFAIAKEHQWRDDQLKDFLQQHGLTWSKQIHRKEYDALCQALTAGPPAPPVVDPKEVPF